MNPGSMLLLLVTLVWGTTFPLLRMTAHDLTGVEVTALRFTVAGLCVLPWALGASRKAWRDGAILGAAAGLSYALQAVGLRYISANRSAFLSSLNAIMVPFLAALWGTRLGWQAFAAALIACTGIGLMSWEHAGDVLGDMATLLCALSYAFYVLLLSTRTQAHDARTLAATQLISMAAFGCAALLVMDLHADTLLSVPRRAQPFFFTLLFLGVVATAGMVFCQTVAQRRVTAERAAVIYAMEPVFAMLFAWWWLGETLGVRGLFGGGLVVMAVILNEWGTDVPRGPAAS